MNRILTVVLAVVLVPHAYAQTRSAPHGRTRVVMLGTGNPVADPDRFGPATVVVVDSTAYLIDAGVGVIRRWAAAIRNGIGPFHPWDLRHVFITHLHSDHTLGYPDLILSSWTLERGQREPIHVFGPPGLGAMTDALLQAYAQDIAIRTGPGGELAGLEPPRVDVHEIASGLVYHDSLVRVTAFAVHHGTFPYAFGYRIQTPDRDIVISGDAALPSAIPEQCHGCDILIHEGANFHRDSGGEYQRQFHTSMEDLADIARQARPKLLVLYHQPGNSQAGVEYVRAHYGGAVVLAHDLDVFPAAAMPGDSAALAQTVANYVDATRHRQLSMELFSDDATFISSSGNYFAGRAALQTFYSNLILSTDSIHYRAGTPVVRMIDANNALVYYTWDVDWYRSHGPRPTLLDDIGMMSITAHKQGGRWLWVSITSQRLPEFFDKITDR